MHLGRSDSLGTRQGEKLAVCLYVLLCMDMYAHVSKLVCVSQKTQREQELQKTRENNSALIHS